MRNIHWSKEKKKYWRRNNYSIAHGSHILNDVWTVDFKGCWYSRNKEKVNPLTIHGENSKCVLAIDAVEKGDTAAVKAIFLHLFREIGLPLYIRSDNDPPFANVLNPWGLRKLFAWWMMLGIQLDRITLGHSEQKGDMRECTAT